MDVTLFSTHCPKCKVLQKKLDAAQISYTEIDDIDDMVSKGIEQVPMLLVDNELLDFTHAVAWVSEQGGGEV